MAWLGNGPRGGRGPRSGISRGVSRPARASPDRRADPSTRAPAGCSLGNPIAWPKSAFAAPGRRLLNEFVGETAELGTGLGRGADRIVGSTRRPNAFLGLSPKIHDPNAAQLRPTEKCDDLMALRKPGINRQPRFVHLHSNTVTGVQQQVGCLHGKLLLLPNAFKTNLANRSEPD